VGTLGVLVAVGLMLVLVLLRFQAEKFGAAEFDEAPKRRNRGFLTRLSWYLLAFGFLLAIYNVHPQPHDVLYLLMGHRADVFLVGLVLAVIGCAQAAAFAWYWYGDLRLPDTPAYKRPALVSIATAIIDESLFRGAMLGTLVTIGVPGAVAVLFLAVVYVFASRLGSGRHPYMYLYAFGLAVLCGWATLATGGIGAAIFGHAAASFAMFLCTGEVAPRAYHPAERAEGRALPEGWVEAKRQRGRRAEPRVGRVASAGAVSGGAASAASAGAASARAASAALMGLGLPEPRDMRGTARKGPGIAGSVRRGRSVRGSGTGDGPSGIYKDR
jgi:hypothetical protein